MAAKWMIAVGLAVFLLTIPGCDGAPPVAPVPPNAAGAPANSIKTGSLDVVRIPMNRQTNRLYVSPDESCVVGDAAGGDAFARRGPFYFVLDADLKPLMEVDGLLGRLAFFPDSRLTVSVTRDEATFLDPKTLRQVNYCLISGDPPVSTPWAVLVLPSGNEWAVVHWGPGVQVLPATPPWKGRGMGIGIKQPIGAAVDDRTGALVIVGDENRIEIIDPKQMKSLALLTAPCPKLGFDVRAAGGRAWIGSAQGTLLPLDLDGRKLLEPIRIADGGDVKLSLSSSGRLLGVVAEKFVDADHHPSVLKAFSVEGGVLVERATMSAVLPCAVFDVAVLERTSRLLLAGKRTQCWDFSK